VCHGELVRLKPHPQYLTSFYLMVALGGALGGVFVGLAAPRLFTGYFELPLGMAACAMVVAFVLYRYPSKPYVGTQRWQARLGVAGLGLVLCAYLFLEVFPATRHSRLLARNFYGALRVYDSDVEDPQRARRTLSHGGITHGVQFLSPERRLWPTAYYGPKSGAGLALLEEPRPASQRAGLIGLGAGVLASYGRPSDYYRFYEINPLVVEIAKTEFTFLKECPANIDIVLGDGRLSLEREGSQQFDVLAVDAFSGDAIPAHLLTAQAFALYFRHLKEGGVLAVHTTNTYLDLPPIVKLSAEAVGKEALLVTNPGDPQKQIFPAAWVLVTGRRGFVEKAVAEGKGTLIQPRKGLRPWTDDYSNLFQILR
ncbi:MAG: fused MFS/spermidine synthase, partial [Acidobacteria bacterium]|nr:fused MFS/spermidine synthase [Acidobacteriota bacterium]